MSSNETVYKSPPTPIMSSNENVSEPVFVSQTTPPTPIMSSNEPAAVFEPINAPADNIFTFNIDPASNLITKGKENENVSYNYQKSTLPQPIQESIGGRKKTTRRKHKQHKKRKTIKHKTKK
jgi:hypothetical protein